MLVKYIDSNYIIETLQKPSWGEVEEPDFYITMASNRVKALIFPSEQGDPNNLASYTEEQQEAIKLATAIYTLWYFDTNYDFTNGSVSVNFGGVSMSESKTYNGEMVLPNVFDILKQANLIPTTETFIFSGENNLYADTAINPKAFKDLQQEVERQADVNIKQDAKLVALNDAIANIDGLKTEIWDIQAEQQEQDTKILTNTNKITTLQNDVKTFYGDLLATQNTVAGIEFNYLQKNGNLQIVNAFVDFYGNIVAKNNGYVDNVDTGAPTSMVNVRHLNNTITPINTKLTNTTDLLNQTIERLRTLKPFQYVGQYQAGTAYNINQVVSFNNNLYLSTEDNNTTQPPTDKWLLLNEDMLNIDLTEYYTKLEVDNIKNDLQNDITANQTEIARVNNEINNNSQQIADLNGRVNVIQSDVNTNSTNIVNLDNRINNEVVKTAGNQTISGEKTFNNRIVANEGLITGTTKSITSCNLELGYGDGTAYITPEDNSNKILKFGGRSGLGKFDIDLQRQSQLLGVNDPARPFHAANKNYVDNLNNQNAKLSQNNTFTGTNTFNNQVSINSAGNDFTWETTRNWNQNIDNTVARTKDFKYVKKWEHTSEIRANSTWDMNSYAWTMDGINTNGIHEFFIALETRDGSLFSFNFKIMWKQGLNKSLSSKITLHKPDNDSVIDFVFAIHNDNKLHMYIKNISGGIAINWVRCWVVRDSNLPWKVNQQW